MQITREVNGKPQTFELTATELYNAYKEQQHRFDRNDIEDLICGLSNDEVTESYGVDKQVFTSKIDDIANEMRRNIDKYDISWSDARYEAVLEVFGRHAKVSR